VVVVCPLVAADLSAGSGTQGGAPVERYRGCLLVVLLVSVSPVCCALVASLVVFSALSIDVLLGCALMVNSLAGMGHSFSVQTMQWAFTAPPWSSLAPARTLYTGLLTVLVQEQIDQSNTEQRSEAEQ